MIQTRIVIRIIDSLKRGEGVFTGASQEFFETIFDLSLEK
jgi:hypothetical protein